MKNFYIKDLKVGLTIFGETFVIKSYKKGSTKQNKPFVDVELVDKTGSIRGKIWSDSIEKCAGCAEGDVAKIDGTIEEFREALQFKITSMTKTTEYDPIDFQKVSEYSTEEMRETIDATIDGVKNQHLKKLLKNVFTEDIKSAFLESSAAMGYHHAYKGGLAEHTVEMLFLAKPIYERYPKVNKDLLETGILLHDIGKITEYETNLTTIMTTKGKLIGHIFIGAEIVKDKAPKDMPDVLVDEIVHMILSHHGKLEFGSPVLPRTTEAIVLGNLDLLSSSLNSAYHAINSLEPDEEFTARMNNFGTMLYRSPYLDNLTNEDIPF